jgi:hypothetical protein
LDGKSHIVAPAAGSQATIGGGNPARFAGSDGSPSDVVGAGRGVSSVIFATNASP